MPELPEVETIARELGAVLAGRRIKRVAYWHWAKTFAHPPIEYMAELLAGRRIESVGRRAKRVDIRLEAGLHLVIALRMTGRLVYSDHPTAPSSATRLILQLDRGWLRFDDARKFGRVWLWTEEEWARESARLGPEPLEMDLATFTSLVRSKRGMLKPMLMDQRFIAGIGNIYADEALWLARLHPRRRAETLRRAEIARLFRGIRHALQTAIRNRGTSIDDYVGGLGEPGAHQHALHVYGRAGKPCERCGTPIRKATFFQRGTHFCPRCQPAPRARHGK